MSTCITQQKREKRVNLRPNSRIQTYEVIAPKYQVDDADNDGHSKECNFTEGMVHNEYTGHSMCHSLKDARGLQGVTYARD